MIRFDINFKSPILAQSIQMEQTTSGWLLQVTDITNYENLIYHVRKDREPVYLTNKGYSTDDNKNLIEWKFRSLILDNKKPVTLIRPIVQNYCLQIIEPNNPALTATDRIIQATYGLMGEHCLVVWKNETSEFKIIKVEDGSLGACESADGNTILVVGKNFVSIIDNPVA